MFIITLGDVFGLIFLGGVIIWIICTFISGAKAHDDMQKMNSIEHKAKQKEDAAKQPSAKPAPWYLVLLGALLFYGICLLFAK